MPYNFENAKEVDIREDLACPLLAKLGYAKDSPNDILRELPLIYDKAFLGRKKPSDPPLRGKPDYILVVNGAGRWILEIKAPSVELNQDSIEQALSYARHTEVSACYAAIFNGKRFILYHSSQRFAEAPLADIEVQTIEDLAAKLQGILSPSAIRRDCTPKEVDLGTPLADGLRSRAKITGGFIVSEEVNWESNIPMPSETLEESLRRLRGLRSTITHGLIWRDEDSRIRAKLNWSAPNDAMLQFMNDKNLQDMDYISLDSQISRDAENPTVFDVVGVLDVKQGEKFFDFVKWQSMTAGITQSMQFKGQATGYIKDRIFQGVYHSEYLCTFPALPSFKLKISVQGKLEVSFES